MTASTNRKYPDNYTFITSNDIFWKNFESLGPESVFIGRLRLKEPEELLLCDLMARGVAFFPSALSQLSCRSKAMQARILSDFMLPDTLVINDLHELLAAMNRYQGKGYIKVVTKRDRANAGMGINLWQSTEDVFNQASLGTMKFPFVLQPFYKNCIDIRVIIIGEYHEAYQRLNPDNFRNNLHFGGTSQPVTPSSDQLDICRQAMQRLDFPYAHVDLMVTDDTQKTFLSEINLRGGIRGAMISPEEYDQKIKAAQDKFQQKLQNK